MFNASFIVLRLYIKKKNSFIYRHFLIRCNPEVKSQASVAEFSGTTVILKKALNRNQTGLK